MNPGTLYCSDPYATSAEEYYDIDCSEMVTPVENLTQKINRAVERFVQEHSQKK